MIKVMQLLRTERQGHHLIVQIPPHWDGLTIEHVLRDLWQVPKKMRHEWRMERAILLNNKPVPFHEILKKGDRMSVPVFTGPELNIKPQIMDLSVLFEDDHFLIVNKKAGLPTHPNHPDDQNTLLNGVYAYLKKRIHQDRFISSMSIVSTRKQPERFYSPNIHWQKVCLTG